MLSFVSFWHTGLFHSSALHLFHDLKCKGTWVDSVHLVAELCLKICISRRVCGNGWFIKLYLLGHCPLWIATFNSVTSLITYYYIVIIRHFVHWWLTMRRINSYTSAVVVFSSLDESAGHFLCFPLRCIEYMNMWMYCFFLFYLFIACLITTVILHASCYAYWLCYLCITTLKLDLLHKMSVFTTLGCRMEFGW